MRLRRAAAAGGTRIEAYVGGTRCVVAGCSSGSTHKAATTATGPGQQGYYVYWDENEEQDFLRAPAGDRGQLIPPWDPNGQMCLVPDHSGRFVVGYNPTLASQHNPGSLKPVKAPPVGEAMYDRRG